MNKKEYLKCDDCEKEDESVEKVICPYTMGKNSPPSRSSALS